MVGGMGVLIPRITSCYAVARLDILHSVLRNPYAGVVKRIIADVANKFRNKSGREIDRSLKRCYELWKNGKMEKWKKWIE